MTDLDSIAARLRGSHPLRADDCVVLDLDGWKLGVRSNSAALLVRLREYFAHVLCSGVATGVEVGGWMEVIERDTFDLEVAFRDWRREPGKTGRKDAYYDFGGGRLVRKVRTGMLFLQSEAVLIASGPCLANDNQVINFINAQLMNRLQRGGALICHASGVVLGGKCLALAGFSGGGKSSLMLRMMEEAGGAYLSNDRLFLEAGSGGGVEAVGIPKLPRVNPGTIASLPALRPIFGEERCRELGSMPVEELWELEEKFDVDVTAVYGEHRIVPRAPLGAVLVLDWQRTAATPFGLSRIDFDERGDLLAALMKSPGPFYQSQDGRFFADNMELDPAPYIDCLRDVPCWAAGGRIDFAAAARECANLITT